MEELNVNNSEKNIENDLTDGDLSGVKEYFVSQPLSLELKEISSIFKESEQEISKEYGYFKANKLFSKMDYLLIDLNMNGEEFRQKCLLCERYNFKSLTVYPTFIDKAKWVMKGKNAKVRAVISYPFGEDYLASKITSLKKAIKSGADEIAYTISVSKIKSGDYSKIIKEIKKAVRLCKKRKFYPLINPQNLTIIEVERCLKEISSILGVFSILILPQDENYHVNLDTASSFLSKIYGNANLEVGGNITNLSDTVSLIAQGITYVSSPFSPKIAEELKEKINLTN